MNSTRSVLLGIALTLAAAAPGVLPVRLAAQGAPQSPAQAVGPTVVLEGELDVLYEDDDRGGRLLHFMTTDDRRRVPLRFRGDAPDLPSGSRVRVSGTLADGSVTTTSVTTMAVAASRTMGTQDALVILFNFSNNTAQPYTPASIVAINDQARSFYLENSYGQTTMTFAVAGWFTIPANNSTCDYSTWASLAETAATSAGFDVASYDRRVFAFPQTSACAWWGMGNIAGARSWINGTYGLRVLAHELGHNFGNYHSHAIKCDPGGCVSIEYGNDRDVLGAPGVVGHMNAFQKERLGWLNYGGSPVVQTVTTSNAYWIDALGTPAGVQPKGLKIWNPADGTHFYVEARAKTGWDGSVLSGVTIHTGSPSSSNSSLQVDLAPLTTTWDSTLDPGQSFSDAALGLSITALSADASGALVDVTFGPRPCATAAPTVTLSPATPGSPSGSAARYTLTVVNNNSADCTPSAFTLGAGVPGGWSVSFDQAALTLGPGAQASTGASVVSDPATAGGQYGLTFWAEDGSSALAGQASAWAWVAPWLDVAATASQVTSKGVTINVSARVTIGQNAVPGAGVVVTIRRLAPWNTTIGLSGTTDTSGNVAVSYKLNRRRDPPGTYQITVDADKSGIRGTGVTSVTVQ